MEEDTEYKGHMTEQAKMRMGRKCGLRSASLLHQLFDFPLLE